MAKNITLSKKMVPSVEEMTKNLLAWYALSLNHPATDFEWYQKAHEEAQALSAKYNLPLDTVIDVIALVSPGMDWTKNIYAAEGVIVSWSKFSTLEERKRHFLTYKTGIAHGWRNFLNAWNRLDGLGELSDSAPKTYRFGENIRFPQDSGYVTIDQHMVHMLCNTGLRGSINPAGYYYLLEKVVQNVAHALGILPLKLQAAVWSFRVAMFKAGYDVDTLQTLLEDYL